MQVLDGVNITACVKDASEKLYRGRLGFRELETLLGHTSFQQVQELCLSNQDLRFVGDILNAHNFPQLEDLNLENNKIEEVSFTYPLFCIKI